VLPVLTEHMASWAGEDRVFIGRDGAPMRGNAVRLAFERARRRAGMPGFRLTCDTRAGLWLRQLARPARPSQDRIPLVLAHDRAAARPEPR
jgi:hypothetical protein